MARILSRPEIRQLVDSLVLDWSDLTSHSKAMLYCTAKHYLDGKIPWEMIFEVDRWPDCTAVMWAHAAEDKSVPVFIKKSVFIHWKSEDGLRQLLMSSSIDWTKPCLINGFLLSGLPVLKECLKMKGFANPENMVDCELNDTAYYLHKTAPRTENMTDDNVTIAPLKPEHSQLVSRTWKFGGTAAAEEYLHYQISTFPSACVYDKDGNPMSWILMNYYGSLGVGHTLPEHRKRGYFHLASKYLIGTCLEKGYLPFVFIEDYNEPSRKAHRKLGYTLKEAGKCAYIIVSGNKSS